MMIKTQDSIDKASDRHLKIVFESQRRNKEVIERMHTMKQLYLRNGKHIHPHISLKKIPFRRALDMWSVFVGIWKHWILPHKQ